MACFAPVSPIFGTPQCQILHTIGWMLRLSSFWPLNRMKSGLLAKSSKKGIEERSSGGEFVGRKSRGSSWLQRGKTLGFLNPKKKLSLGKKRKILRGD